MNIEVKDAGVLAAMLDEAEELLKNSRPTAQSKEKAAKLINQLTDKASELIEEAFDAPALSFSVTLPPRYYAALEALSDFGKKSSE